MNKVSPGQLVQIPAAVWNDLLDTARAWRRTRLGPSGGGTPGNPITPAVEVLVKNATGGDLSALAVLTPDPASIVVSPVDEPYAGGRRPALSGIAPADPADQPLILLEAIPDGAVGRAVIGGVAVVDVNVVDGAHKYAVCQASNTALMDTAAAGTALILWRESGSSGTKRALVLIGGGQGGGCHRYIDDVGVSGVTCSGGSIESVTLTKTYKWEKDGKVYDTDPGC